MSKIIVNQIESSDGTTDVLNSLSAVNVAGAGIGQVLQVVSATVDEVDTTTAVTLTNSALSAAITPSSSSSKILINASVTSGSNADENNIPAFGLRRDSTDIGLSTTASGSRKNAITGPGKSSNNFLGNCALTHLDSPSTTSEAIYYVTFAARSGNTTQINSTGSDADAAYTWRGSSTITLMEIAG